MNNRSSPGSAPRWTVSTRCSGGPLAGPGHSGRSAPERLAPCGCWSAFSAAFLLLVFPLLAVAVQAVPRKGQPAVLVGHPPCTASPSACRSGHRYRRRALPEAVHPESRSRDRHDGRSSELERKAAAATLVNAFEGSGIKRRKLIWTSAGIGLGAFGLGSAIALRRRLIKNPWKPVVPHRRRHEGRALDLRLDPGTRGETIYLGRATSRPGESAFTKDPPGGHRRRRHGMVFPRRRSPARRHQRRVGEARTHRDGRAQSGDADPASAGRHAAGGQASGPGELQLR